MRRDPRSSFAFAVAEPAKGKPVLREAEGCLRDPEAKGSDPQALQTVALMCFLPFAESAKGKCPRHTRAMGS